VFKAISTLCDFSLDYNNKMSEELWEFIDTCACCTEKVSPKFWSQLSIKNGNLL